MLVTDERFKTKNHLYMLEDRQTLWDIVHLELSQVYFFISYEIQENEVWISQHAMAWQMQTFMAMCNGIQDSEGKHITSVSLMIPPYGSKTGRWEMIALKAIWRASRKDSNQPFVVYMAENGTRYTDQSDTSNLTDDDIEIKERLFPLLKSAKSTG